MEPGEVVVRGLRQRGGHLVRRLPPSRLSPVAAVAYGALAGAVGTAAMDCVWFARYKRGGGEQGAWAWETAEGLESWDDVAVPGQVGRRLVEGFRGRPLPARWARVTTNAVHWVYGVIWGAQYGIVAASAERPRAAWGVVLGSVVWTSGYAVLPLSGLYKPVWEYDAKTLAKDLSAHLVYGATAGAAFAALARRR